MDSPKQPKPAEPKTDPTVEEAKARLELLARQRRGRAGLIATTAAGVGGAGALTGILPTLTGKTKLGE